MAMTMQCRSDARFAIKDRIDEAGARPLATGRHAGIRR
jgi:hypothetical protein